jgi:signal transduction histidine kinase
LNAIWKGIKEYHELGEYDFSWQIPSLVMLFLSCFPILFSLLGVQMVWIISMGLQACGFFSFALSVSIRFYTQMGMETIPTYMLSIFALLIAVFPLLVFIFGEYFLQGFLIADHGAYLIIHAGAATMAGVMAVLVYGHFTQSSSRLYYPLVLLFLAWMLSEIHLLLFWRAAESEIISESLVPYVVGSLFSLINLVRINRWIRLRPFEKKTGHPVKWFLPRLIILIIALWLGYVFEEALLLRNPNVDFNPFPRSLLLIGNLAAMFLFSILAMNLLKLRRDWRRIEIVATGILSIWIVPNILKGIFRNWTIGWWCAELVLFFGLLWGPMILGILYLESMIKEDESRRRASFYADLLVHDITNYHQAILLSLGLLEMNMQSETILQQALQESQQSLQRAKQLVRNVKHIGMTEILDSSNLHAIDVVYSIKKAFIQTLSIIDMQYVEFYCPYNEEEFYANANDHLVEVFINLIRNAIQFSPDRKRIEFRIQHRIENTKKFLIIEVIDYGRGIEPKLKPSLFQEYDSDEIGARVGLSVVNSIISSYGGSVSIKDRVPEDHTHGSIFIIKIPAFGKEGM